VASEVALGEAGAEGAFLSASVAVADFDGNGHPDLAATNFNGDRVSIRLGQGDGTFAVAPDAAIEPFPTAVAVGDFTGDGQPDLAVGYADSSSVAILINTTLASVLTVAVDIKPGSFPNRINPQGNGAIPVAVLTTKTFDATTVDPLSLRFGPKEARAAHGRGHVKDANDDGKPDLVLHFRTQDTGIKYGDSSASLTGKTFDGHPIRGSDSIKTVGCKK
jgi:FG-GAP-like repeat